MSTQYLILDLDETLVHTYDDCDRLIEIDPLNNPYLQQERHRIYFQTDHYNETPCLWGVLRPHLAEFLDYVVNRFDDVIVWSAGSYDYVWGIVNYLFPSHRLPKVVFTRNDCETDQYGCIVKPIQKITEIYPEINLTNTFFIDDKETAFLKNERNGIIIPPYQPNIERPIEILYDEDILLKLVDWFNRTEVIASNDIRELDKKIF